MQKKTVWSIVLITAVIWAIWLPMVTSGNLRMDSERMLFHAEEALSQYVSEGRIGLVFLLQLFGLTTWRPVYSGVLFLIFFSASAWLLCWNMLHFLRRDWQPRYGLFVLLYATSPIWAFHAYFTLQLAPVGLGLMLTALLAGLDARRHTGWRPPYRFACDAASTVLLGLLLTVYQGLIVHYLAAAAMMMLCHCLSGAECRMRSILVWAARVLAALGVYLLAAQLTGGGNSAYLAQQIQWGRIPVLQCLMNIAIQAAKLMTVLHSACFSLYPAAAVLCVLFFVRNRQGRLQTGTQLRWLLPILAAMLLLPLAMSILQGSRPVPRTEFALQIIAAAIPVCYMAAVKGRHTVLRVLCVSTVLIQVALNVRLLHTDNVRNAHDEAAGQAIISALADMDVEHKPLIVLGSLPFTDDSPLMEKADVFGRSFFEWIYSENQPGSASPSVIRLLRALDERDYTGTNNAAMLLAAVEQGHSLPAWPEQGSIVEADSFILLKLPD